MDHAGEDTPPQCSSISQQQLQGQRANVPLLALAQVRSAAPAVASIQARTYAEKATPTEVSSILEQRIRGVQEESNLAETGRVLSVGYVQSKPARCWSRSAIYVHDSDGLPRSRQEI